MVGEKHENYVAAFGGHLFCDLFLQGRWEGGHGPLAPRSATVIFPLLSSLVIKNLMKKFVTAGTMLGVVYLVHISLIAHLTLSQSGIENENVKRNYV